uniref:V-SNARE coiled-coil homology domain-containing protein n=2 Tax=Parascaris univalens TaxID=6257 RepID=A0A915BJD9_PARUN
MCLHVRGSERHLFCVDVNRLFFCWHTLRMEMIGSMKSSSFPSSIPFVDSLRHSSIEEMLSESNFLVDESEIRPLTPPRSPVEHLAETTDAQCCENDFVKEINKALHYLYEDSVQNNRARYKKAMAHLNDLLCLYNAQIAQEMRSSITGDSF